MYLYKVLQTFKVIVSFRLLRCTLLVSIINQFTIKIVVAVLWRNIDSYGKSLSKYTAIQSLVT